MSRSIRNTPIGIPYPPRPDFTIAEAEQRIAMSQAAIAAGHQKAAGDAACPPVAAIDIPKLEQLASDCMRLYPALVP